MKSINKINKDIKKISKILIFVSIFIIIELYGHIYSNSLSLLADAMHLIVDVLGYIISLISLIIIKKGNILKNNFGYFKLEPLGALLSIMLIWVAMGHLLKEAIKRFKNPLIINEKNFIIIGLIGFLLNIINLYILGHKQHNLNMKAVYIHLIGDIIQTIGILITSLLTYFYPKMVFIDSICSLICGIFIIISSFNITKQSIEMLLDSFPKDINKLEYEKEILKIKYILEIIDLKIWAQSKNIYVINLKIKAIIINNDQYNKIKEDIYNLIHENKRLVYITIEIN